MPLHTSLAVKIACLALLFSASANAEETRQEMLARTTGKVAGMVLEEATGLPLSGVSVSAQYLGDSTDSEGRYEIIYLDPGTVPVTFWRRDTVQITKSVDVHPGETTVLDFLVEKALPACCELDGTWLIEMKLKQEDQSEGESESILRGTITFSKSTANPFGRRRVGSLDDTLDEFGMFDLDLPSLFGQDYFSSSTREMMCDGQEACPSLREASGYISKGDKVEILLIPRMSDFGVGLSGRITKDSIEGEWTKRALAPSVRGEFVMKRESR